jgi:hypothetical protein
MGVDGGYVVVDTHKTLLVLVYGSGDVVPPVTSDFFRQSPAGLLWDSYSFYRRNFGGT